MRSAIIFLFIFIAICMAVGFYIRQTGAVATGDKIVGLSILASAFVLMPMFLYHRWKDRKVKDYMLDEDNIKKMREFNNGKKDKKNE